MPISRVIARFGWYVLAVLLVVLFTATLQDRNTLANSSSNTQAGQYQQQAPLFTASPTPSATTTPACGLAWRGVPSPSQGSSSALEAVAALSPNDIWGVGLYNGVGQQTLTMHWDGQQWSIVPSPNVPGGDSILVGVAIISSDDVWAVGRHLNGGAEQTLSMHWDGQQWSIVPTPNGARALSVLSGVAAKSSDDVWAVGDSEDANHYSSSTLIEHWDGQQWSIVSSPDPGAETDALYGVTVLDNNDAWAVGRYSNDPNGANSRTLTLHWDGVSWSQVDSPNQDGLNMLLAVSGAGPDDVWAVGEYISGPLSALSMHWNGTAWSLVTVPPVMGSSYLESVAAISANNVWAVGGTTWHWDGSAWSWVYPIGGALINGISAASGDNVWAVGGDNSQAMIQHYSDPCASSTGTPTVTLTVTGTPPNSTSTRTPTNTRTSTGTVTATTPPSSTPTTISTIPTDTPPTSTVPEPTDTATTPTATDTATPDCSSVEVSPTDIWPPGAFINVTVPPGWTWEWVPITPLMQYHCGVDYPTGVECAWSCTNFEPRVGSAEIDIYDQNGVERCVVGITGNQPWCPSTPTPSDVPTNTPTATAMPTSCTLQFSDVPPGSTFYPFIHCLACLGLINGYSDGTFKPNNDVTRGQLSKIVSNSAGFSENQITQMFEDVPVGSTFFQYIVRLASRGYISGYPCGGPGEPCGPDNLPYFLPGSQASRGQISKIVSNAAGFTDNPTGQQFQDVPPSNAFYPFIYRLVLHNVMSGYPCDTPPAGACVPPDNLPYFLPNANATRGQTSKIVSNTFFPDCQTSDIVQRK